MSLDRSYGVFATTELDRGTYIAEYKGHCSRYSDWAEHIKRVKAERGQTLDWPYIPEELYGMSIFEEGADVLFDGFESGSIARWCHRGHAEPASQICESQLQTKLLHRARNYI